MSIEVVSLIRSTALKSAVISDGPQKLITALLQAAMKRHCQHVANIHRNYGREIGFVSKRGTVKLRYVSIDDHCLIYPLK